MKTVARRSRHARVRSRISGTAERPRLVVFRGARTFSLQLIDDTMGRVLVSVTTQSKRTDASTVASARKLGGELAKAAQTKKISRAVFDRAGYQYHGRVKAAVDSVREGGMTI